MLPARGRFFLAEQCLEFVSWRNTGSDSPGR